MSKVCILIVLVFALPAFADVDPVPLINWTVPGVSSGTHSRGHLSISSNADLSGKAGFVAITPCRLVDTRGAAGAWGGPQFSSGETRAYPIPIHPTCIGIPANATAYSLNFSVTQTAAGAYLTAWPYGATQPTVASLTWFGANQTLSSASIVPAGTSGAISVFAAGTTHVIIDINGYFLGSRGPKSMGGASGTADLFYLPLAANESAGGRIQYTIRATDGTSLIVVTGELFYAGYRTSSGAGITCPAPVNKATLGNVTTQSHCGFFGPDFEPLVGIADTITGFTPTSHEVFFEVDNQPGSLVVFLP